MLSFSSASTKDTEHNRSEGAMLNFNNPLIVLSLLLPLVAVERTTQGLASMCRGVRVENPDIKECLFTSLPEAPMNSHWVKELHQSVEQGRAQLTRRMQRHRWQLQVDHRSRHVFGG